MNRRGDAIVVWEQEDRRQRREIWSAYKPFDGNFGAPQLVQNEWTADLQTG